MVSILEAMVVNRNEFQLELVLLEFQAKATLCFSISGRNIRKWGYQIRQISFHEVYGENQK